MPRAREHVDETNGFDAESALDGLLGQVSQRALSRDRAGDAQMLGVIAQQHGQQRRLARAVTTNQTDLFAVAHDEGDGLEDAPRTDLDAEVLDDQHSLPPVVSSRARTPSAAPGRRVGTRTSFLRRRAGVMRILL